MGDLPAKMDRLLDILEIISLHGEISLSKLSKMMKTKISGIKIYIDYLEELGLVYREKKGKATTVKPIRNVVTRVGDTMVTVMDKYVHVWRCPFKDHCPYYSQGCTTADKCYFAQTFLKPMIEALNELSEKIEVKVVNNETEVE